MKSKRHNRALSICKKAAAYLETLTLVLSLAAYRLYLFKQNTNDTLYQFGFNTLTGQYEYGHLSIPELKQTNIPDDTDTSRFAMMHDGTNNRFYCLAEYWLMTKI